MADLTLERIAELRAWQDKVRALQGCGDLGRLALTMHDWGLQLQMSAAELLEAAERGLKLQAIVDAGSVGIKRPSYNRQLVRAEFYNEWRSWCQAYESLDAAIDELYAKIKEPTDG